MLVQASQLLFIIFCADLNSPVAGQGRYFALSGVGFGVVRYVLALVSGVFGFHDCLRFVLFRSLITKIVMLWVKSGKREGNKEIF